MYLHTLTGMYEKNDMLIPKRLQQVKEKYLDFSLKLLAKHYN